LNKPDELEGWSDAQVLMEVKTSEIY